jgi:hypothetical protein
VIFMCSCIWKLSLVAGDSTTTMRSKKLLTHGLQCRRHHSMMQGYRNLCTTMTSASKIVETMLKSSIRYVYQMAI